MSTSGMRWGGLEYLKVRQWRTAFETADVIFGVDVASRREILVFGRGALQMIAVTGMEARARRRARMRASQRS